MSLHVRVDADEWAELGLSTLRLADALNVPRRETLISMREQINGTIQRTYHSESVPGGSLPARYLGEFGSAIRVFLSPNANWLVIQAHSRAAYFTEFGRGPGGVNSGAIAEWAQLKLGLDNPEEIGAIIAKIKREGTNPGLVLERATSLQYPGGRMLSQALHATLAAHYERFMKSQGSGWS